ARADVDAGLDLAAARDHPDQLAVDEAALAGVLAVHLDEVLGLADLRARAAPGLGGGVVVVERAPGAEQQRVLVVGQLLAGPIRGRLERGLALDRAAAVERGRAGVIGIGTRPLQAALLVDPRVGDAGELIAEPGQLVVDLGGALVIRHRVAAGAGDLAEDLPVGAGLAGRVDGLADPLDPTIGVGEHAVLLGEAGGRQHHVGVAGGLVQEDVLDDQELDVVEALLDVAGVGLGQQDVLAHHVHALDLPLGHRLHHDVELHAVVGRQLDPPGLLKLGLGGGIADPLVAGIEHRARARVVGPLHVVLSAQRVHAGRADAEVTGHQHQVGEAVDVVGAVGVLGDPERVVDAGLAGGRVGAGGLADHRRGHAGDLLGPLGGGLAGGLDHAGEAVGVPGDELAIDQ